MLLRESRVVLITTRFLEGGEWFPGWQQTAAGEREVQKALRKNLLKYKLHTDQDLFDRAYGYIRQYY